MVVDNDSSNGALAMITSVLMALLSLSNILIYVQIIAGIIAIISGIFAIRYYAAKINEVKELTKSKRKKTD